MAERTINNTGIYCNIFELKKDIYASYQHVETKTRNFIFQSARNIIDEMIIAYSAAYAETDYEIKLAYIKKIENLTMSLKTELNILSEIELVKNKHLFTLTDAHITPLESDLSKFKNRLKELIKQGKC